eukprot:gene16880-biopygen8897
MAEASPLATPGSCITRGVLPIGFDPNRLEQPMSQSSASTPRRGSRIRVRRLTVATMSAHDGGEAPPVRSREAPEEGLCFPPLISQNFVEDLWNAFLRVSIHLPLLFNTCPGPQCPDDGVDSWRRCLELPI